jgi:small subunit ribosomal protein S1
MDQHESGDFANDFASLYENSLTKMNKLQAGQMVETQIVSISKDCIFLQLSGKSEGVLDRAELADQNGNISVKEGDTIKAFFLESKNGEMRFTTKISGDKAGSALLENAYKNKIPVDGVVEKEIKGGFEVKLGTTRAFCPFSQMGARRTEDTAAYIGKKLTFKIQEYKDNGRSILVSNRAILEDERAAHIEELKKTMTEGMTVTGKITSIQDFGAFVDIGGVQALLPVSEISRERVQDIRATLTVGQEIEATILKIDWKTERISISMKSLLSDPWTGAAARYPKNSKHVGTVSRIATFGAFVTLENGLDGLVHVSELRGDDKFGDTSKAVKVGQKMTVLVLGVDEANRRISLKPASSLEEDETVGKYLSGGNSDGDTYNPFAALLKKK